MFEWFKKKNKLNERQQYLLKELQELKRNNLELKMLYEKSIKYAIKEDIKDICKIADKILNECINDNSKVVKLNLFIHYYQNDIIKILSNYISIKENKIDSFEANEFILKVEVFIKNVVQAFENILENLVVVKERDIDADIKIMLENLSSNKLLGDNND